MTLTVGRAQPAGLVRSRWILNTLHFQSRGLDPLPRRCWCLSERFDRSVPSGLTLQGDLDGSG
ncbi:hypothetical protein [Deinococcus sp. UYEF24]